MAKVAKEDELFTFVSNDSIESEKIIAPRYSYWRSVFRVFFKKKINWVLIGIFVLLFLGAFIIPIFCPYNPTENVTKATTFNLSPSAAREYFAGDGTTLKWIFGTGGQGNSIFYGIWASAKTSLTLAIICAAINMVVGVIAGAVWGYSKSVDQIMLVIYNIIANVPYILVITVLVYVIGAGFWSFVFALTITGWLSIAYFFRTQVMIIRDREYSLASRC
nr:ABC transporter permease subunit [Sphaerochaetaceae bacterium]